MRIKNKKTGEIASLEGELLFDNEIMLLKQYSSLAELNSEWEDYNELEYWYIDDNGDILLSDLDDDELWKDLAEQRKQIGNYFETKEETEKAEERLCAWTRLKDKGIKIIDYECSGGVNKKGKFLGEVKVTIGVPQEVDKYLFETLFGGEE